MSWQRDLEVALNAATRTTRIRRVNAGALVVADAGGSRRVFRGAPKGTGDLVGYAGPDGLHVEVEVKLGKDRVRPAQRRRRDAILAAGGVYVVVRGVETLDLAELERSVRDAVATVDNAIRAARELRAIREGAC
jgi:hypothetical protein